MPVRPPMIDTYGDVIVRGLDWADDGRYRCIEILEAAPRTLVDDEVLNDIREGRNPWDHVTLDGDVLTIRGTNRTVVYRIVGHHPDWLNRPHTWVMEWPD